MTHGQVEVGGQPKGLRLLCVLIRDAGLVLQPGHNLLVLQHSLLVLAFLQEAQGQAQAPSTGLAAPGYHSPWTPVTQGHASHDPCPPPNPTSQPRSTWRQLQVPACLLPGRNRAVVAEPALGVSEDLAGGSP